jgi:hypothetical protein
MRPPLAEATSIRLHAAVLDVPAQLIISHLYLLPGQQCGQPLPIRRRQFAEFGGQPCQRVALVDSGGPFAFSLVPSVEGFGSLWRRAE